MTAHPTTAVLPGAHAHEAALQEPPWIDADATVNIVSAMIRMALMDYLRGYDEPRHPSARAFLVAAGLVDPETGVIDAHGYPVPKIRRRKRA